MSETLAGGGLVTVLVPRTALEAASDPEEAYQLVGAVVGYVNDIQQTGVYGRHELPARAMHAYHADYYLAEVNNGGHSQFIHNCGERWPVTVADVLAGLEAMGARAQHRILAEAAAWVQANPQEAAAQDGFGVRAAPLDALDERFYAAERDAPMTPLAARWIRGWPELRVVGDDEYAGAIEEAAALNPHLAPRRIWQSIEALRYQMTDTLQASIAVACGAVAPEPEAKTAVRAGAFLEIEDQQQLAFGVGTDKGSRLCVADEAGARLYEFIDPTPKWTPDLKIEEILKHGPARPGGRLSTVSAGTIARFSAVAHETRSAEAIDLLLRTAKLDPRAMLTAWRLEADVVTWIIVTDGRRIIATTSRDGATMLDPGGTAAPSLSRADIERHSAEAAKGLASLGPSA